jgi:D-alanyl-D-alanine carboxypeptidase
MQLQDIGEGFTLDAPCARDFLALKAAATAAGHAIHVSTAYRSNATQKGLYTRYIQAIAAWERSGRLGTKPTPVAIPGKSLHELGHAVDIHVAGDSALKQWLDDNCGKFNFKCDVPREPWHYSWRP